MPKQYHPIPTAEMVRSLIDENQMLRESLRHVSAVGVTMMHHTHRANCSDFSEDFLKSVITIDKELEVRRIGKIYEEGYHLATGVSVIDTTDSSVFEDAKRR